MRRRRAYSVYLLFGVVICLAVAVGAIVKSEYAWLGVGVGGVISCSVYFLSSRRNQEPSLPAESEIARRRESRKG
jgi:hypothetical protein